MHGKISLKCKERKWARGNFHTVPFTAIGFCDIDALPIQKSNSRQLSFCKKSVISHTSGHRNRLHNLLVLFYKTPKLTLTICHLITLLYRRKQNWAWSCQMSSFASPDPLSTLHSPWSLSQEADLHGQLPVSCPWPWSETARGQPHGRLQGKKKGKLGVFKCFLHLSEAVLQLAVSLQLLAPPRTLPWGPISACTPQAKECSHFHRYWPQWTAYSSLFLSTVPTPFLIVSLQFPQIIQWASLPVSTVTVTVKKVGCVVAGS